MSETSDKPADLLKKVRRRTGEGEGLADLDEEKVSVVADPSIDSSVATPTPSRTVDRTTKKTAAVTGATNVTATTGQAARMRFRRDRRPKR
ncbi:MAG TPA: hypothetical protein VMP68_14185 [Candidatus Eisenbacteria bacterium]|nr:hypothetical protein [Candidatus Eisenbacteria bacterium]